MVSPLLSLDNVTECLMKRCNVVLCRVNTCQSGTSANLPTDDFSLTYQKITVKAKGLLKELLKLTTSDCYKVPVVLASQVLV